MWKYRCKRYLLYLIGAFLLGVLFSFFTFQQATSTAMLEELVPQEVAVLVLENPVLIYLSGGLFFAGICNVFLVGSLLMSEWNFSPIIFFILAMIFPSFVIEAGILLVPVSLILFLYGWLSLKGSRKGIARKGRQAEADEIVRVYCLHHSLDKTYQDLGNSVRSNMDKANLVLVLGAAAFLTVLFFYGNFFTIMLLAFVFFFLYQYLMRFKANCFYPISQLLYDKCDPEACISALIYFGKRGDHYHLKNQPLMAQSLIYLDDPSLAQDVLATYPRPNAQAELTYWALMSYTYYQLADEQGLQRCLENIQNAKTGFNRITLMLKSEEMMAVKNKIELMDGEFNKCKQYYLTQLKKARLPLIQADCSYYIALISFVQKDYSLASIYFDKVASIGNKIYFVAKAEKYIRLLEEMNADDQGEETVSA